MAVKKAGAGQEVPETLPVAANERGEFPIRIARDGTWYYRESPIRRNALVRLFASVLRREENGGYSLVTPVERGTIEVDDAPFTAVEMECEGQGRDMKIRFRTNLDEWVAAGPSNPIRVKIDPETGEPAPYVTVRDDLPALIARPVFYALAEVAVPVKADGRTMLRVWSGGAAFDLGPAE